MIRPRVLFVVNEVAHYLEFKKILTAESVKSHIDHLLLFDREGYDVNELFKKEIQDCQQSNINYLVRSSPAKNESELSFFKRKISELSLLFKAENISAIILAEENILMDTFLYKKAFKNKPVLVYPYTIPNPKEMAGGAYSNSWLNIFAGRFSKIIKNNVYLLIKPSKIQAMRDIGYFPKNPWVLNDDTADMVCIESKKMAELYNKLGVRDSRLTVTGTFNDDLLAQNILKKDQNRTALLKKYGLADKPILLVGFPPNQFPREAAEHNSYEELISAFARALQPYLVDYSVIITKHPRMKHSLDSMTQLGFVVAEEPTIDLIPHAYIYIASVSATIRWALAAGIPVINYDLYRYDYGDYDSATGVVTVSTEEDFQKILKRLLRDSSYFSAFVQRQKDESSLWGVLDGNASLRFLNLINNLLSKGKNIENT